MLGDFDSAWDALNTAKSLLTPPLDKFLGFSEALIHAKEKDVDAALISLQHAEEIIDQLQLKFLQFEVYFIRARISEAEGDYEAMAKLNLKAIEHLNRSVVAGDLRLVVPLIFARVADAQIIIGNLDAAEQAIEAGSRADPSEPMLWLARARLQRARNMPQLALASVNYALAIWKDADENFVMAKKARVLVGELQSIIQ